MDGNTIRKGIEEVKTGLQLAVTMYEKQKKLWDQNIGSEAQFLQAKSQKESLEQRLQTMEAQLSMTYIKAPVSGIVDEIKVKLGEMANPGFSGIRVVNGKELKVKANLSDVHIGKVKKGDKVELIFPDLHKSIQSNVSYVGQSVNANNRTIMVEAKLPNANNEFKANQFSKMKINDGILKNAIVVPSNLVQHSISGEYYVLVGVPENGLITARKKLVKMGVEYNGETQILEGLQAGDLIITAGYNEIVDGQHIQI
jgi:RND family efflux transporter MFP subunit